MADLEERVANLEHFLGVLYRNQPHLFEGVLSPVGADVAVPETGDANESMDQQSDT